MIFTEFLLYPKGRATDVPCCELCGGCRWLDLSDFPTGPSFRTSVVISVATAKCFYLTGAVRTNPIRSDISAYGPSMVRRQTTRRRRCFLCFDKIQHKRAGRPSADYTRVRLSPRRPKPSCLALRVITRLAVGHYRLHKADASEHRRAAFRSGEQNGHGGLPLRLVMDLRGQRRDVVAGFAECRERLAGWQPDWFVKGRFPRHLSGPLSLAWSWADEMTEPTSRIRTARRARLHQLISGE